MNGFINRKGTFLLIGKLDNGILSINKRLQHDPVTSNIGNKKEITKTPTFTGI